jgi:hypothetical protein
VTRAENNMRRGELVDRIYEDTEVNKVVTSVIVLRIAPLLRRLASPKARRKHARLSRFKVVRWSECARTVMQTANEAILVEKIPSLTPTHDAKTRLHLGQKIFLKRADHCRNQTSSGHTKLICNPRRTE